MWSIAVEWHLYALFPALYLAVRRWGVARVVGVSVLAGSGLAAIVSVRRTGIPTIELTYVGLFAVGIAAAALYRSGAVQSRRRVLAVGLTGAAVVVLAFAVQGIGNSARWLFVLDPLFGLGVAAVLLFVATSPVRAAIERPALVAAGEQSYSTYLIHAPLVQLLYLYAVRPLGLHELASFVVLTAMAVPTVIVASYALYRSVERPSMTANQAASMRI